MRTSEPRVAEVTAIRVPLPEPYVGWFCRVGDECRDCSGVWCGDGACACGATWTTEVIAGAEPDPEHDAFWLVTSRPGGS